MLFSSPHLPLFHVPPTHFCYVIAERRMLSLRKSKIWPSVVVEHKGVHADNHEMGDDRDVCFECNNMLLSHFIIPCACWNQHCDCLLVFDLLTFPLFSALFLKNVCSCDRSKSGDCVPRMCCDMHSIGTSQRVVANAGIEPALPG